MLADLSMRLGAGTVWTRLRPLRRDTPTTTAKITTKRAIPSRSRLRHISVSGPWSLVPAEGSSVFSPQSVLGPRLSILTPSASLAAGDGLDSGPGTRNPGLWTQDQGLRTRNQGRRTKE